MKLPFYLANESNYYEIASHLHHEISFPINKESNITEEDYTMKQQYDTNIACLFLLFNFLLPSISENTEIFVKKGR